MTECETTIEIDVGDRNFPDVMREVEARYLAIIMTKARGNKTLAAKHAGLALDTFRKKVARYTVHKTYRLE